MKKILRNPNESSKKPTVWPVLMGNALEFFDLGLYGCLAPVLAEKFFPSTDPLIHSINAAGLFAAGFITRPLGAIIFGAIADQQGRKKALTLTLGIMGLATLCVGFLPVYGQVGIFAPLMLTLLRLIQGICAGGEYNPAAVFILENTIEHRRGFMSGIVTSTAILGFLLASLVTNCSLQWLGSDWSWRLPFLLGSLIAFSGYFLRLKTMETISIANISSLERSSIFSSFIVMKNNLRASMSVVGVGWLAGVLSLSIVGFLPQYLSQFSQIPSSYRVLISQLGILVYLMTLPIFGLLSDRLTPKRLLIGASLFGLIVSFPIFFLILSGDLTNIITGVCILSVLAGSFLGPMHAYMFSLFSANQRCRGISMGFSIGVAIFGGSAPLISASLMKVTGLLYAPAFYFFFSSMMGLIAVSLKHYSSSPNESTQLSSSLQKLKQA